MNLQMLFQNKSAPLTKVSHETYLYNVYTVKKFFASFNCLLLSKETFESVILADALS